MLKCKINNDCIQKQRKNKLVFNYDDKENLNFSQNENSLLINKSLVNYSQNFSEKVFDQCSFKNGTFIAPSNINFETNRTFNNKNNNASFIGNKNPSNLINNNQLLNNFRCFPLITDRIRNEQGNFQDQINTNKGNKALRELNIFFKQKSKESSIIENNCLQNNNNYLNKNEFYNSKISDNNNENLEKNLDLPISYAKEKQIPFEYVFEIWTEYKFQELTQSCLPKFEGILNVQSDINFDTRAILIDWLIDVQEHFKLSEDTLFQCFSILDRSLSLAKITKEKLQLLGVTAFSIACKFEEIYPPFLKDWVSITDNSFTSSEILHCETELLNLLKFDFNYPTCFSFLQMISFQFKFTMIEFHYACYLLEMFAHHSNFNKYLPSLISLAVAYLILKFKKFERYKDLYLLVNNCYNENDLKFCAREIYDFSIVFSKMNFKAVIRKYSTSKYNFVAIKGLNLN